MQRTTIVTLAALAACAAPTEDAGGGEEDTSTVDASAGTVSGSASGSAGETDDAGSGSSASPTTPGSTSRDDDSDTGTPDETGPGPAGCPGLPGDPGLTSRTLTVGATMRDLLLYIPESLDPEVAVPLVLVHHGASMSGMAMYSVTGFTDVADDEGFIVAFPDGTGPLAPWNVGPGVCPPGNLANGNGDDFAFVDAMVESIAASHCVDRERVFVTGFSMGGYFSNHVGCAHSDSVRAVAPHSGGTYTGTCDAGPIPVMLVHGTADALINLDCGTEARDEWIARNGCSAEFDVVPVTGGSCQEHRDCPDGGQVTLCTLEGMGHGWAGGSGIYGGGTQYEDASRLIWSFFAVQ
jgi:polyhydroxybutyrate depolymerase